MMQAEKKSSMENTNNKNCNNCFHAGKEVTETAKIVCGAYRAFLEIQHEFGQKFPYVDTQCFHDPAMGCTNFVARIQSVKDRDLT